MCPVRTTQYTRGVQGKILLKSPHRAKRRLVYASKNVLYGRPYMLRKCNAQRTVKENSRSRRSGKYVDLKAAELPCVAQLDLLTFGGGQNSG